MYMGAEIKLRALGAFLKLRSHSEFYFSTSSQKGLLL